MSNGRADLLGKIMAAREDDPAGENWFAPTSKALGGLTAAQAAWVPGEGMNTIWQIVNHLTFWTRFVAGRLAGEPPTGRKTDSDATFGSPGDPADAEGWARAVQGLRDAYGALHAAIARQTDAELDRPFNSRRTPTVAVISGSVMHDAYHTGQIVLLRRLQGSWS